jgi:hypothetical protein
MREVRNHQYENENFTAEKLVATLYLIMFVLIVGVGIHPQLLRNAPDAASSRAIETALR